MTSLAFKLDPVLEASAPPEARGLYRDSVRLLITKRDGGDNHLAIFSDLPHVLRPGDLLVANDSATVPAALRARFGEREFPLHLGSRIRSNLWIVEPRTRAALTQGATLNIDGGAVAKLLTPISGSQRLWYALLETPNPIAQYLDEHGKPIRYGYVEHEWPIEDYQTIFSRKPGSVEMPSAARPFTLWTLDALAQRGIELAMVTLHCGLSSPERDEPPMAEWTEIPKGTIEAIASAKLRGSRVVAIGTTVVRALETARGAAYRGWTNRLITKENPPRVVDGLITGLHEPQATHMWMLEAFLEGAALARSYDIALHERMLWHEFGDVHLIL